MIKVEEKLYVNADVFFDKIAESIAYDITASTGKNIRPKQIHKGFSYTKDMKNKMKREGKVKVTITDFEAPRIYKAKFESSQGINTISYEIEQPFRKRKPEISSRHRSLSSRGMNPSPRDTIPMQS